ncbi:hypothetical protein THF1C08_80238 [Vibrio jasicida]|uniref:Uncharacterized protein n=1 Tax=Vibrio jasicida TaxID=766224 RepID=A0AAU9QXG4_9VIBR|nr:hypothetical protein THF1C08_80238 [Vibrio jasicida]CAH1603518.1 hypothetical protein THF1A12_70237 [Vibrio jasicida]
MSLTNFETQNAINACTKPEKVDPALEQAIRHLTQIGLTARVDVTTAAHFIDRLLEAKNEPSLSLASFVGLSNATINNIVRQEVITHFNELAKERDKEL